ncbi:putative S-acyltransferase TIP1-like [Capsicum annuum]|nr:putative S-acyltransferase TIP1-like [Capsicum annuum]
MLPRDISQLIFNHLVDSCSLSDNCIDAFRGCALQDMCMGECTRVNDKWMDVISSQGSSLLSAYISSTEVTDFGLSLLRNCSNLQALGLDCCDKISARGIEHIGDLDALFELPRSLMNILPSHSAVDQTISMLSMDINMNVWFDEPFCLVCQGFTHLTYLGFRKCCGLSAEAMKSLSGLMKLVKLEFERCPLIHGGFVHLEGLTNLESLTLRSCKCITDSDLKPLAGLVNLKELQISCNDITNVGVSYLRGITCSFWYLKLNYYSLTLWLSMDFPPALWLRFVKIIFLFLRVSGKMQSGFDILHSSTDLYNLVVLNLEGSSEVTAACLDYLTALTSLKSLNVNRCHLSDDGCEKFSALSSLKELNLGFNNISDTCLGQLNGMTKLEGLYLDSCRISNDGLAHLAGLSNLKALELSDTEVGSNGIFQLSGLTKLEDLNLSFTSVTDSGLIKLCGLTSLRSLNLDARQITNSGLAVLTSLTGLTHLDLFGAQITDSGTKYLSYFKNLQSLDLCGGRLTDAGVNNIKDLTCLMLLNLSQNMRLSDTALEFLSGLTSLVSLNISNSRITNDGLQHLKPLKNLRALYLEFCGVTACEIKKLQATTLPDLARYRPNQ